MSEPFVSVIVYIHVKPDCIEAFKEATFANGRCAVKEEGLLRFDCQQDAKEPTKFVLIEVYKNAEGQASHLQTEHYFTWKDTVADMMAEPRTFRKYNTVFPKTEGAWGYPDGVTFEP